MATTAEARRQLEQRRQQTGQEVEPAAGRTLVSMLNDNESEIAKALPQAGVTPKQLIRVAMTCVKQNPLLARCTPESVAGALMHAAHVGLLPGGTLGHAHLVPYRNKDSGNFEAQFQIGWQGLVQLARRSGEVAEIWADVIREADRWEIRRGLDRDLIHEPAYDAADRGEVLFAYAVVKYVSGARDWVVLDRNDLEKRKRMSQTGRNNKGPWVEHFEAMARKSAIKALAPFMPLSLDDQRAFSSDGAVVRWDPADVENLEPVSPDVDRELEALNVQATEVAAEPSDRDDDEPEGDPDDEPEEEPLRDLTVAQLRIRCRDAGLPSSGTKDELVARLENPDQAGEPDDDDWGDPPAASEPAQPQPEPEPEPSQPSLQDRALAHAQGTYRDIDRLQDRIRAAFNVLAVKNPDVYEAGWDRLQDITDGRASATDWDGASESRLRSLAEDMERAASQVSD